MQKDVVLKCSKICFNILHKDCSGGLQYITNAGNLPDLDFKISKVVTSLNNEHVQATLSQYSKLIVEKKLTLLVHDLNFKASSFKQISKKNLEIPSYIVGVTR